MGTATLKIGCISQIHHHQFVREGGQVGNQGIRPVGSTVVIPWSDVLIGNYQNSLSSVIADDMGFQEA